MQPRASIRCEDPAPRDNETRRIIARLSPDEIQQWRLLFREFPPVFRNLMKREDEIEAVPEIVRQPAKFVLTGELGRIADERVKQFAARNPRGKVAA